MVSCWDSSWEQSTACQKIAMLAVPWVASSDVAMGFVSVDMMGQQSVKMRELRKADMMVISMVEYLDRMSD